MKINYSKAIYDIAGDPLEYPSKIIEQSLLVLDDEYHQVQADKKFKEFKFSDESDVNDFLVSLGQAPISGRVAQIAFGANRNLENIAWKFRNYTTQGQEVGRAFLAIPGFIHGADVVACNIGYWGYVYAGLLTSADQLSVRNYLKDTICPVTILLLDEGQMRAMHKSEGVIEPGQKVPGVSCGVSDMEVNLSSDMRCMAQVYSLSVPFMSFDGKTPVPFQSVKTKGRTYGISLDQKAMFSRINKLLNAEKPIGGRTPIADTLKEETLKLLAIDVSETRKMSSFPLYADVREKLATDYVLKDSDGKVRKGLEDILPIRSEEAAWQAVPNFNPLPK